MIRTDSLTSDDLREICALIRRGVKPTRAIVCVGYHRNAFYYWRDRAAAGEEPHRANIDAMERAEAEFLASLEDKFQAAANTDWRAAQAFLQSRAREDYGQKVEVTATTKPPEDMTREELLAIAAGKPVALPR